MMRITIAIIASILFVSIGLLVVPKLYRIFNSTFKFPVSAQDANCPLKGKGDVNCDGFISSQDILLWNEEYLKFKNSKEADVNFDSKISLKDFEVIRHQFCDIQNSKYCK